MNNILWTNKTFYNSLNILKIKALTIIIMDKKYLMKYEQS